MCNELFTNDKDVLLELHTQKKKKSHIYVLGGQMVSLDLWKEIFDSITRC